MHVGVMIGGRGVGGGGVTMGGGAVIMPRLFNYLFIYYLFHH
jgi:hypothetical protein